MRILLENLNIEKKFFDDTFQETDSFIFHRTPQVNDEIIYIDDDEDNCPNSIYTKINDNFKETLNVPPLCNYYVFQDIFSFFEITKQKKKIKNCYSRLSFWQLPLFIISMSMTLIIFQFIYQGDLEGDKFLRLLPRPNNDIWRLFTYSLLHGDWNHVILNIIALILLGLPLELIHGKMRLSIICFFGVISGGLLHSAYDSNSCLLGCSSAVMSILACSNLNLFNWNEIKYKFVYLFYILIFDIWSTYIIIRSFNDSSGDISGLSHAGGLIAGLCMGTLLLKNLTHSKIMKIIGWILFIIFIPFFTFFLYKYLVV
ncbi:Rhomboid-related protein 2 [Strongyloides ratti]|uniref:Rhomboid-related protein 2 n=1 Tax=Strongyloides ratti TaxID=34506 RepID=A0A090LCB9_STRRB|nr:Rhomboid-related protein 2 [Strongyloides ratti]CEF67417.1 Rhomboid-related protein 2 [Strongyloides ratti]